MNKYKTKKEVTEHVAGMVVTEPDSGGGNIVPYFAHYDRDTVVTGEYEVKYMIPNRFGDNFLYKATFKKYQNGEFVNPADVIIYADIEMMNSTISPTYNDTSSSVVKYEAMNPMDTMETSDGRMLYFSGNVNYSLELSASYRQSHSRHYGFLFWPDISGLIADGEGYIDRIFGSVENIQKTTMSELKAEGIQISTFGIFQCPVYTTKYIG